MPKLQISACPDRETLTRLMLGELAEPSATQCEQHVEGCPQCAETIDALCAEDTLVQALKEGAASQAAMDDNPVVQRLTDSLRDAGRIAWTDAVARSGVDGQTAATAPDSADDWRSFFAPPQNEDELGQLGSYRIRRLLGAGGMGAVFLAEDLLLGRLVALKIMKPRLASSEQARKRFLREARAAAAVVDDHIVSIHQVGEDRGLPFLAMPWLQGESLESRLDRESRLPVAEALRIARETAMGLAAAHQKGLLHRDIKPANIWLETRSGGAASRVKIVDFGLARAHHDESSLVTQQGAIIGTPAYMAPEQAQGDPVDQRCDLFSLGCVMYRMITGHLPFPGKNLLETMLSVLKDKPAPANARNPEIPQEVTDLITKLLAKRPDDRISSAIETVNEIQNLEQRLLSSRRDAMSPGSRSLKTPPQQKRRWLLAVVVAFAFLLGGSAGLQIYRVQSDRGTLIVEINDESVEAKLKQNGLIVTNQNSGRQFTITAEGTQDTRSGEYRLTGAAGMRLVVVDDNGLEVKTNEFKLLRGGEVRLRVVLEHPLAQIGELSADDSPDRRAAEWAMGRGARMNVEFDGEELRDLSAVSQLPWGDFRLRDLCFFHDSKLPGDDELAQLEGCDSLRLFLFKSYTTGLGDEALAQLSKIPSLVDVSGDFGRVTGSSLAMWHDHPNITTLGLFGAKLDDEDLREIARIGSLRNVMINSPLVTAAGYAHLKTKSNWRHLGINGIPLDDVACEHISGMKSLSELFITDDKITDAGVQHLATLPGLSILCLYNGQSLTDTSLEAIGKIPGLTSLALTNSACRGEPLSLMAVARDLHLQLDGTRFSPAGFTALSSLRNVRWLGLARTNVTDDNLTALVSLDNLWTLDLSETAIGDGSIENLKRIPNLRELVVTGTRFTAVGLIQLHETLPHCRIIPQVTETNTR